MEMERFDGIAIAEDQGPWPWFWTWRKPLSESVFLWSGLWQRTSGSQERSCGCCVATSSTRGECSSKDVWPRVQVELLAFTHCSAGFAE